ncbi:MAG: gene transfer agent family protein [Parvibaculaceae bacterium]
MANRHRGEVTLKANGRTYTLCLTLGALAELEDRYGGEDILSLAERFSSGRLTSADARNLLSAALKGGGEEVEMLDPGTMVFEGGMAGLIRTLAELLAVTFGLAAEADRPMDKEEPQDPVPFPGTRS